MRPRVGHIQFVNSLPIYYGLVKGSGILDLDLVRGLPTELNTLLLEGKLDVSPISSIEYARHCDDLLLLPGPTVSCRGPVGSILLLSRLPAEELDGRKIALTTSSATSHVLLPVLLEKHYGVHPAYFPFSDNLEEALARGDGALLIGDSALEHRAAPDLHIYDLGREWFRCTGAPMTFAVWAVRREFAIRQPDLVGHIWALFQDSISYCASHIGEIALDASRWELFSASFLEEYFRSLAFGFERDIRDGLRLFYTMAAEIGEVTAVPGLSFCDIPCSRDRKESSLAERREG